MRLAVAWRRLVSAECVDEEPLHAVLCRDWQGVGDNSNEVGPISKSMIIGKVQYIIWPLNGIRPAE